MTDEAGSDAELARQAAAGDERAFAALMRRHKGAVYRLTRRNVSDSEEAYDVVQEVFVAAWRNLERYDPERPLRTWLFRIAINKCRDRHRRRSVRAFFFGAAPLTGAVANRLPDEAPQPERLLTQRDALHRAEQAIAGLPRNAREAFLLHVIEGLPQKEIAATLGVSVKAVETRVARARRLIAERLEGGDSG